MSTLTQFFGGNSGVLSIPAEVIIVGGGGGGGGGTGSGGGGGGGGTVTHGVTPLSTGFTYAITVGGGGTGGAAALQGANGTSSHFGGLLALPGGGGGGGTNAPYAAVNLGRGGAGNSGATGGSTNASLSLTASVIFSQLQGYSVSYSTGNTYGPIIRRGGYIGGNGYGGVAAGGGGGAGPISDGQSTTNNFGGPGGNALAFTNLLNIYGVSNVYLAQGYGGGGGGGGDTGLGGTPNGASTAIAATAGPANTGNGGGAGAATTNTAGANGGSGIVIICYPDSVAAATTTGSPAIDTSSRPGFRIYTYNASGTFLIAS